MPKEKTKPILNTIGSSLNVVGGPTDPASTAKKKPSQMGGFSSPSGPMANKMKTPAPDKSSMRVGNDDLGTFLTMTDVKGSTAAMSRKSPEPRKSQLNVFNPNKSVDNAFTQSPLS